MNISLSCSACRTVLADGDRRYSRIAGKGYYWRRRISWIVSHWADHAESGEACETLVLVCNHGMCREWWDCHTQPDEIEAHYADGGCEQGAWLISLAEAVERGLIGVESESRELEQAQVAPPPPEPRSWVEL